MVKAYTAAGAVNRCSVASASTSTPPAGSLRPARPSGSASPASLRPPAASSTDDDGDSAPSGTHLFARTEPSVLSSAVGVETTANEQVHAELPRHPRRPPVAQAMPARRRLSVSQASKLRGMPTIGGGLLTPPRFVSPRTGSYPPHRPDTAVFDAISAITASDDASPASASPALDPPQPLPRQGGQPQDLATDTPMQDMMQSWQRWLSPSRQHREASARPTSGGAHTRSQADLGAGPMSDVAA